jgi:hypothetical protein
MNKKATAKTDSRCQASGGTEFKVTPLSDQSGNAQGACVSNAETAIECVFPPNMCDDGSWVMTYEYAYCERTGRPATALAQAVADGAVFGAPIQVATRSLTRDSGQSTGQWFDVTDLTLTPKGQSSVFMVSVTSTFNASSPSSSGDPHTAGWARVVVNDKTVAGTDIFYGSGRGSSLTVPVHLAGAYVPDGGGKVTFRLQIKARIGSSAQLVNSETEAGRGPGLFMVSELPFAKP